LLIAQNIEPDILTKVWKSKWITVPDQIYSSYGVYLFSKELDVSEKMQTYIVHVSADNRYKLFVNGKMVSTGPSLGDLTHWNYETVNIASYLNIGKNTISALVWNEGKWKPVTQYSAGTAFIMQGNSDKESAVNTDYNWQCTKIEGYSPLPQRVHGYYALGPGEFVDMNLSTYSLFNNERKKDNWYRVNEIGFGVPKGCNTLDASGEWMLVPSSIPPVEMNTQRLSRTCISKGISVPSSFPAVQTDIVIPANTSATILLDQFFLINAYPTLIYTKGKNASVSLRYAESLYDANMKKGNRNEVEGKSLIGRYDSIVCNGLSNQNYTPLSWRTYRYLQLDIQTKDQPLIINDIYGTTVSYPFQQNSTFQSNVSLLTDILNIGWRTARLCAVETYFDCPYYEQLQYIGDARIQALISYYNSGDDRLARKAIDLMDNSRLPEGITQSRYPSDRVQIIPPYSLFWIGMVYDYYRYRPDTDFVKSKLQGIRQVLNFFSKYQLEDGSLKNVPYWNFTDWAENNPATWHFGVPPIGKDGCSSILDLQLLWAYQLAAVLENDLGEKVLADTYTGCADKLAETIKNKYWDRSKMIFADNIDKNTFSEHANVLAILTEMVAGKDAANLYRLIEDNPDMVKASIYFKYYSNQAMNKAGYGNDYLSRLDIWKRNIELGLTTWGEDSDVEGTRSDCHAWGSSPNIEFFRIILGIDSDAPGFGKVKIEPHLGELTGINGTIPHNKGKISTSYTKRNNKWTIEINLPDEIEGTFVWKGICYELRSGKNNLTINE